MSTQTLPTAASSSMSNGVGRNSYSSHSQESNLIHEYARILFEHTRKQMDTTFGDSNDHDEYRRPTRRGTNSTRSSGDSDLNGNDIL